MKRWHDDLGAMKKQSMLWNRAMRVGGDPAARWESLGRYRKKHALDCGRPQCQLCHYPKIFGERTRMQEIADWERREQLAEFMEELDDQQDA
jgi:hypothetical protein